MVFIETSVFTRAIQHLLSDEEYQHLQMALLFRPDAGSLIPGSGGLRKIRWNLPTQGKRGGLRIIYYWDAPDTIYLLLPYQKAEKEDLTKTQIRKLSVLAKEWLK